MLQSGRINDKPTRVGGHTAAQRVVAKAEIVTQPEVVWRQIVGRKKLKQVGMLRRLMIQRERGGDGGIIDM